MINKALFGEITERIMSTAFDYKKEYKEFYMPKAKPEIVTVPKMNFIAVRGGSGARRSECGRWRVQSIDRTFVWNCIYDQDEQEG